MESTFFLCTTIYTQLTLSREIIGVYKLNVFRRSQLRFILIQNIFFGIYCENTREHINMACCQNVVLKNFTNMWKNRLPRGSECFKLSNVCYFSFKILFLYPILIQQRTWNVKKKKNFLPAALYLVYVSEYVTLIE